MEAMQLPLRQEEWVSLKHALSLPRDLRNYVCIIKAPVP